VRSARTAVLNDAILAAFNRGGGTIDFHNCWRYVLHVGPLSLCEFLLEREQVATLHKQTLKLPLRSKLNGELALARYVATVPS